MAETTDHESTPSASSTPDGASQVDEATIDAVAKLIESMEMTERARGHLYAFHQLTGGADLLLGEAADLMIDAGHRRLGEGLASEIVGRNVLPDRWTYQVVEEYEDEYYQPFRSAERTVRNELVGGLRHLPEALMKRRRRTAGHAGHTPGPPTTPEGGRSSATMKE